MKDPIMSGLIIGETLGVVLQMINQLGRSGELWISGKDQSGSIWYQQGELIHASTNTQKGEDALISLLTQKEGQYQFWEGQELPERSIHGDHQQLLMRAAQLMDESAAALEAPTEAWDIFAELDDAPPSMQESETKNPNGNAAGLEDWLSALKAPVATISPQVREQPGVKAPLVEVPPEGHTREKTKEVPTAGLGQEFWDELVRAIAEVTGPIARIILTKAAERLGLPRHERWFDVPASQANRLLDEAGPLISDSKRQQAREEAFKVFSRWKVF